MDIDQLIWGHRPLDEPSRSVVEEHRRQLQEAINAAQDIPFSDATRAMVRTRAPRPRSSRWSGRGARGIAVLAAAAAATAIGVLVLSPFGSDERSVEALISDAAGASAEVLAQSGRAKVTTSDGSGTDELEYVFSGDNSAHIVGGEQTSRTVDGFVYVYSEAYCPEIGPQWWRDDHQLIDGLPELDRLLAVLSPDADFEIVGEEPVADVLTTHLRAGTPGAVPDDAYAAILGSLFPGETRNVTALEVWVDDSDIVRRIDVTFDFGSSTDRFRRSIVFSELGDEFRIEAPPTFRVLSSDLDVDPCSIAASPQD